jgi:hypothetical protein
MLILLLRNVYSQPRLDVFAVLTVHASLLSPSEEAEGRPLSPLKPIV